MRNEITIGDFKNVYFKVIDADDEKKEKIYLNEDEAVLIANRYNGKVMKVTKRMLHTMKFERITNK